MTDVNQITSRMTDGTRVLAAISAERDTKHHGQETSFAVRKLSYHSILPTIISLSLFEEKKRIVKHLRKQILRLFDRCNFADYTFSPNLRLSPLRTPSLLLLLHLFPSSRLRRRATLPSLRAALYSTLAPSPPPPT